MTEPRPACLNKWEPFDILIEGTTGPGHRLALFEARRLCASCPVRLGCWTKAREDDEDWLKEVQGIYPLAPVARPTCGTTAGATAHYKHREKPCDPCRLAANARPRNRPVAQCGTDSGYYRHRRTLKDEPCNACNEAHATVVRERAQRRDRSNPAA